MKLILYQVADSDNVINKNLGNGLEILINLKGDTDVTQPTIRLSRIAGIDYRNYNYAFIDLLNRYYFITDATVMGGNLTQLDLKVDVLETYKSEILASNARIKRSLKTGDYMDISIEKSNLKSVSIHKSDISLLIGVSNKILTVVGA